MQLLLATLNRGKLAEIRAALASLSFQLESLDGKDLSEAVESGTTFRENAYLKARHYHQLTGIPTLGEDSGLEVHALADRPGVYSARLAPTDEMRIQRLLESMERLPRDTPRRARFVSAFCILLPGHTVEATGTVEGEISRRPRGSRGFGYDPIFYYPPLGKTFGEMTREEKNSISHRGQALTELRKRLEQITTGG